MSAAPAVLDVDYLHVPAMAPTQPLIDVARKEKDRERFGSRT